jgi:hypothetical protein
MANTFELIASTTLSSAQASLDFTSIPNTFTDLCLKFSTRTNQTQIYSEVYVKFNTSTANISTRLLEGNGVNVASYTSTTTIAVGAGANATANTFSNFEIYVPNYAGSTNKSFSVDSVTENNGTSSWTDLTAGLWSQTAAITGITIYPSASWTFATYSTAYLYGIKNS